MASYKIEWDARALKELRKLPNEIAVRILNAISPLSENPYLGQQLKGAFQNFRRLRVGDYRIIYSIMNEILTVRILRVAHRREVYHS